MIDIEEQLTNHLERVATRAVPHRDLDAVINQSAVVKLRLVGRPMAVYRSRARLVLAAAGIAATGIAAVAVVALREDPSPATIVVPATNATPGCQVFLQPEASESTIAAIGERLRQQPGVINLQFVSQQQAYETFLRIFAGREDLTKSVTMGILPPSWTFDLDPDTSARRATIAAEFAGDAVVKQVRCEPSSQSPSTLPAAPSTTQRTGPLPTSIGGTRYDAAATDCSGVGTVTVTVTVPDVTGLALPDAIVILRDLGFSVFENGVPAGDPTGATAIVRAQEPPSGSRVPAGSCVGFRTQ